MELEDKFFRKHYILMLFFIFCLLVEGYINHYHYLFSNIIPPTSFYNDAEKYSKSIEMMNKVENFIWFENGVVEIIQILLLIISIILFFSFIKKNKNINFKFSKYLLGIYFIGILYYFLEEISWGQHFFQWNSPEFFNEINEQKETNLHNINNLFNQLPRNLLLLWCSFTFLIVKLNYFKNHKPLSVFLYSSSNLKSISLLVIIFTLPSIFLEGYLNFAQIYEGKVNEVFFEWNGERVFDNKFSKLKILIVDFINLKFIRLSELQELLFNYYIITHIYYLRKNSFNKNFA